MTKAIVRIEVVASRTGKKTPWGNKRKSTESRLVEMVRSITQAMKVRTRDHKLHATEGPLQPRTELRPKNTKGELAPEQRAIVDVATNLRQAATMRKKTKMHKTIVTCAIASPRKRNLPSRRRHAWFSKRNAKNCLTSTFNSRQSAHLILGLESISSQSGAKGATIFS